MASPAVARRRFLLVLLLLLVSFAATSTLVWERRAAWHVVRTLPGVIPGICSCWVPVPAVHCREEGTLYFADTGETYQFPPEYRGRIEEVYFHRSRGAFQFTMDDRDGEGGRLFHCWNLAARREVPLPVRARDCWGLTEGGTRILALDVRVGEPRRFQVIGLDGSVLQERVLPPLARTVDSKDFSNRIYKTYRYSEEGSFLVVHDPPDPQAPRVQVLDMASPAGWSFDDSFGGISDDGVVWLVARPLTSDDGRSTFLRAVRLKTARELWRIPIPEGIEEVVFLGHDRVAVRKADQSVSLYEGTSGRWLFDLERAKELCTSLEGLEVREAGARTFLLCWGAWDFETGRLLPAKLARFPAADFFSDGRRALRPGDEDRTGSPYPDIVDVDTGKSLFRFDQSAPQVPLNARRAGERVLTATQDGSTLLWERRHPEGWSGQFRRPEVLVAVFLGAAIVVLWLNRPRPPMSGD